MAIYIRLTEYGSSSKKEQEFFNPINKYVAEQSDFDKITGSPIAYWVSNKVKNLFDNNQVLGDIYDVKQGMATSDNNRFLRYWEEVGSSDIGFNISNLLEAKDSLSKWFPYNKGGEFRKWYGNNEYLVNYGNDGYELKEFQSTLNQGWNVRLKSREFYFRESVNWSFVSSGSFGVRYSNNGFIFDVGGSSLFPKKEEILYVTSLLTSNLAFSFLKIVAPTINFQIEDVKSIPIIFPEKNSIKQQIDKLTQQNIDISKEEWDSRETSWDFIKNELIKHKDSKIKMAYSNYCNYWQEKFFTLHKNEEELNRLFLDIYELQDELDEKVELKDITILKHEAKIIEGELVFQADEIMKQFISYGVGVMFGRYSLDSDGLLIANIGQEVPASSSFEIDDDNVIPVLEDDYFTDDIASRFVIFVKTVFGEESLRENIAFIEDSLGVTLRKYFVKGFYEDHIKRYKKRPIYWMVASPKKGFMSLMYMHRYTSDIFATVQNGYLREYMTKLEASRENAQREADDASNSATQRSRASKSVEKINKTLDEIIKFDRETLTSFAQSRIEIDLDDGVKVNYCKFKEVLFEFDKKLCK